MSRAISKMFAKRLILAKSSAARAVHKLNARACDQIYQVKKLTECGDDQLKEFISTSSRMISFKSN